LARNGQLRILFREVAPPDGIAQKVETSLEGVAVGKNEHLKLDGRRRSTGDHSAHALSHHWNSDHVGSSVRDT
jgi:hypothetical protein